MDGSDQLKTVDRALSLLVTLGEKDVLTAREAAKITNQPLSTVYRYLGTLKRWGLVNLLPGTDKYVLGPRCVQLEVGFRRVFSKVSVYQREMLELASLTNETVAILVPLDDKVVCVDVVESSLPLRYSFSKGIVRPMLRGASAKAMLPFLPREHVEKLIETSEFTEEQRNVLYADIEKIRANGYAASEGEVDEGVWAVGVPIFGFNRELEATLSIIAPTFRVDESQRIRATRLAMEAANNISTAFGWHE